MSLIREELTVGIEEELFLVDQKSLDLCQSWPKKFTKDCEEHYPCEFVSEFLASQVEIVSPPYGSVRELSEHYLRLRSELSTLAQRNGLALMAAATHPAAKWRQQQPTDIARYKTLENTLKIASRRLLVSGTHIHVGIACTKTRFYLFKELLPFLPYFLMLSASSPFWGGHDTGFNSYRANVMLSLPRSGIPPLFKTHKAYERYIQALVNQGVVSNGREVWWDIRLSARFPTIEVRLADTCTETKTAMALVALLQSLVRYLMRNQPKTTNFDFLSQNRWCAERYPIGESVFFPALTRRESTKTQVFRLLEILYADAVALGVEKYFMHLESIAEQGASADKQRKVYQQKLKEGFSESEALHAVMQHLCEETIKGLPVLQGVKYLGT